MRVLAMDEAISVALSGLDPDRSVWPLETVRVDGMSALRDRDGSETGGGVNWGETRRCALCHTDQPAREFEPRPFCGNLGFFHRLCRGCQQRERRMQSARLARWFAAQVRTGRLAA